MVKKRVSPNKTLDPLDSLSITLAFATKDWSEQRRDAWIYGIVCGWDMASMHELEDKGFWNKDVSKRLRKLHKNFKKLEIMAENADFNKGVK